MLLFFSTLAFPGFSQTIGVGSTAIEDYYRRQQLMGKLDSTLSFSVRPLTFSALGSHRAYLPDSNEYTRPLMEVEPSWRSKNGKMRVELLPASVQFQVNSHHPYGWNDGAMIPAKGLQSLISGGVYASYGPLSIQFKPEFVFAANSPFETFNEDHYPIIFARYYDFYNQIDLPARFGTQAYNKAFMGQSSIRLNHKGISLGVSTENLWWGPGKRSALLMSNNAPGFLHATLNTIKPINSPIGSFEGQLIGGRLKGSGFGVLEPELDYLNKPLYVPKRNEDRYITGYVLSWQPKWVKGLFLGMTHSEQAYRSDIKKFGDWLPFHTTGVKEVSDDLPLSKRDVRNSFFMRWLWEEEQAEFYIEYGKDQQYNDGREAWVAPERSRAYVVGMQKIIPFNRSKGENLLISLEVTQLQKTHMEDIRKVQSWYIDPYIRHGYTHRGQVLGAGIGPGGNLQSLEVSWFKGVKRIGIQFERSVHNNDFYYYAYEDSKDFRRHWTDLSFGAVGEWNYQNLIFNFGLKAINSLNYQWYLFQGPDDDYMVKGKDAFNLQVQAGLNYRF